MTTCVVRLFLSMVVGWVGEVRIGVLTISDDPYSRFVQSNVAEFARRIIKQ